ncbi:FixJ family two-component response regulator [Paraburkholderia sp. JPY465]
MSGSLAPCDNGSILSGNTTMRVSESAARTDHVKQSAESIVYVIDDDAILRRSLSSLLRSYDLRVETFATSSEFLAFPRPAVQSCLILDMRLEDEDGLTVQQKIGNAGLGIPVIFMTGYGDVASSVTAMKGGALDFLTKPFEDHELLDAIQRAFAIDKQRLERERSLADVSRAHQSLTPREREVMTLVISGLMNKQIAATLNLQEITVKVHRSQVMKKMKARTLPDLVRMAEALGIEPAEKTF